MRTYSKKNIRLMYVIAFLQGIVIYATISTLYRESRGLSLSDFAIIESFSYFFTLAFEIPFGFIADRIGYKRTLVLANGFYFLSKIIFWKAYSFPMFLLERFFMAIAYAGISGVDSSILYLSSKEEESQKSFSFYAAFSTAGMLFGSLVFTIFLSKDYTGCAFYTMIAYGLAFFFTCFLDEVRSGYHEEAEEKPALSHMISTISLTIQDIRFLGFLMSVALISNASWLISVMLNQDKYLSLGLSESHMGIIAIVISIAGLFSAGSDLLTKKFGFRSFLTGLTLLMGAAAFLMGYTKIAILAILSNFFVDFSNGLLGPLISELENERVSVSDRATQLSVYGMVVDVISIGLSILTSQVAKLSFRAIFVLAAMEFLTAIVFFYSCYGFKDKNQSRQK